MVSHQDDPARIYLQQKEKNLNYFKVHLPRIYQMLDNLMLTRAELVVTPGEKDIDMTFDGRSCYRGLAREYSRDEVRDFLNEHRPDRRFLTYSPAWPSSYNKQRFAARSIQRIIEMSPVTPENFQGYKRGSVFPSIVFLGCGLGFHIESMVEQATIVNAIVVEREPEKFALSLFTVDWAKICSTFQKKGFSLNFAIGFASSEMELRDLLSRHLAHSVPLYPYTTLYYNHLADIELARVAMDVGRDLALVAASWSNYDDELMRLKNSMANCRLGIKYLPRRNLSGHNKPVVIVGSGPSLDERLSSLVAIRDRVVVVSAGTGLRPLLTAGIKPDLHVELDPNYMIYELHSELGSDLLKEITLLAGNEVNPKVASLFGRAYTFYRFDSALSWLAGVGQDGFVNCNPTCVNAALSILHTLGCRKIFMLGTDFGYVDNAHDHSSYSVYGEKAVGEVAAGLRKWVGESKRQDFSVPAASGIGVVQTRFDYYAAKVNVEGFLREIARKTPETEVFNCSDGAAVEGALWLAPHEFESTVNRFTHDEMTDLENLIESNSRSISRSTLDDAMPSVEGELERGAALLKKIISKERLRGRKDLALLANTLRLVSKTSGLTEKKPVTAAQQYQSWVLGGTVLHFVHVALCHGFACEDEDLPAFMTTWREGLLKFLDEVAEHFSGVVAEQERLEEDPWMKMNFESKEPGWS
ncbi:hypothetical protein Q667_17720 [Marinobacter sp. C1S70]|uniref:motility associated factor glycosyltransferase family protein n=1 Tax=Marinobacter sp. C1S70 TaxID=1396859 RepID=UPI0003B81DAB|nr:6-hydroxymethylpterin diphosphokinase MptE-like protein [Marinobacter sp. C1S70]ERS85092.1 hypothetical protein Q667_17720 [Marinobacter sp. C1S70]